MSSETLDVKLVAAARGGAQEAVEELVGRYLPLVYNIVGRSLSRGADVDDVVQEAMLRVVRGLPGLRDEHAFRSWLVAVTMSQVREYRQSHVTSDKALGEVMDDVADPGADFVDLSLTRLGLSGQRRETVQATRWLDEGDRELLSLWWLVAAGHLTRAELVQAIGLDSHHVTVRVSRMKEQLDSARLIVRALAADPRCVELSSIIATWDGQPSGLWRKRLARHVRACATCGGLGTDLIPPERLLVNLALVPLPVGFMAYILTAGRGNAGYEVTSADVSVAARPSAHTRHRAPKHRAGHSLASLAAKPALVAVTLSATIAAAIGVATVIPGPDTSDHKANDQTALSALDRHTSPVLSTPSSADASADATPSASRSASAAPSASLTPTPEPTTTHRVQAAPSTSPAAAATTPPAQPSADSNGQGAPTAEVLARQQQVLAMINKARTDHGLRPYTLLDGLSRAAQAHNLVMASGCGLQHQCPNEPAAQDRDGAEGVHGMAGWENIGMGDPAAATQAMLSEQSPNDGHLRNILNPNLMYVGIAVYWGGGNWWMTQDFSQ
ncbi:sigma-70 family RNA polymerase sigma factor [Streptomyces sp. NPDC051976]|uniref:sigma-70 family RNA polymerase sigma factor n=1 Tax=Streptomyces sp. NPDC051976 TaxID=3154947 RepID=UPI00344A63DF